MVSDRWGELRSAVQAQAWRQASRILARWPEEARPDAECYVRGVARGLPVLDLEIALAELELACDRVVLLPSAWQLYSNRRGWIFKHRAEALGHYALVDLVGGQALISVVRGDGAGTYQDVFGADARFQEVSYLTGDPLLRYVQRMVWRVVSGDLREAEEAAAADAERQADAARDRARLAAEDAQ